MGLDVDSSLCFFPPRVERSTSWNQDCREKYQYADDTTLLAESEEELKDS